jgi:tetratricopeptide (TPR) repeat protein
VEDQPDAAFVHFLSQERIDEALKTIGLDPAKPDYVGWVAKRFARWLDGNEDEDEKSGSPESELLMLAGFLESRGMGEVLDAAYSEPLASYAKEDKEAFIDFMGSLFQTGYAPMFAMEHGAVWAGDDEARWDELFSTVFGTEKEVGEWLGWIEKIEPGVSNPDKMRGMMALFGIGADPGHLGEKWLEKAWQAVEKSPEDEKTANIQKIRALAVARQDVTTALKARDRLGKDSEAAAMWTSIDRYLSAANRWKDAAEILESSQDGVSNSPELHAYLATTLRRAGMNERAAVHDKWAERLSLGYAPTCSRIGDHYMYGGDPERAEKWYRQAACQADVSGSEFPAVLDTYARSMLEDGRWEIAASCYEALVQAYASQQFAGGMLQTYAKARLNADLAKALAVLPENRERAISLLEGIHRNFATDGILADDFFPLLRKAGLNAELTQWFGESWEKIAAVIERFPDSDNTRNTAAWLASRAGKKLQEAEKHLKAALDRNPGQAAYLDTMAEVRFAQGDRKGAVKWSDKSLLFYPLTDSPYDVMIRKQNWRFKNAPLPK